MRNVLTNHQIILYHETRMTKIYKCRKCGTDIEPNKYPYCRGCLALLRVWLSDAAFHAKEVERRGQDDMHGYYAGAGCDGY